MRKATLPRVERVNRLEGQQRGDFLDVMMGEIFSPWHFYIQVPQLEQNNLWVWFKIQLQLKDPGSKTGAELDDLVDEMEDTYSNLSNLEQNIAPEELTVSHIPT